MERSIVGFRRDEEGHWVAELECGHGQHMRHDPPWQSRPWTASAQGRAGKLGVRVNCLKCDRNEPPAEWAQQRA
ncbi:GNAT family acetyltransferase [Cupriavidus sp. UYMSc13B]|nr:GNAT family acetyltransferase [Cupriavidus sp. UYMSc13B]